MASERPNLQISQCSCPISCNAPLRMEMCMFLFWMVHCGIWDRCTMGFVVLFFCLFCQADLSIDFGTILMWCHVTDGWKFPEFFKGHWQSPCTALTAGKCLPLVLSKETVKESVVAPASMIMMTSLHENSFHITDPLWGDSTGDQLIPLTKAQ